jgi:hypothetical protein
MIRRDAYPMASSPRFAIIALLNKRNYSLMFPSPHRRMFFSLSRAVRIPFEASVIHQPPLRFVEYFARVNDLLLPLRGRVKLVHRRELNPPAPSKHLNPHSSSVIRPIEILAYNTRHLRTIFSDYG